MAAGRPESATASYDAYETQPMVAEPDFAYGYDDDYGEPYDQFEDPSEQFDDQPYDLPSAQSYDLPSGYPNDPQGQPPAQTYERHPNQPSSQSYGRPSVRSYGPAYGQFGNQFPAHSGTRASNQFGDRAYDESVDQFFSQPNGQSFGQPGNRGFASSYDGFRQVADPFGTGSTFRDDDPYRMQYLSQQQYQAEHGYQAPASTGPRGLGPIPGEADGPLREKRSLALYIVVSLLTLGIGGWYYVHCMARDANTLCAADGERTTGVGLYILLCILTFGIYSFFWTYKIAERLYRNAPAYGVRIEQNGVVVLLWNTVGALLIVGPFIAMHYILRDLDELSRVYNETYVYNW